MKKHSISVLSVVASSFCSPFSRGDVFKNPFRFFFALILLIGCSSQLDEELLENNEAGAKRVVLDVNSIVLVNAEANVDIGELTNNSVFDVAKVNIRAESNGSSVVFQLTGAETHKQIENAKPFALMGDNSGTYNEWIPKAGDYTLKITPYTGSGGNGTAGRPKTIQFRVVDKGISQDPAGPTPEPGVYFAGNFENVTIDRTKISGWSAIDAIASQGFAWNGSPDYVNAAIITDNGKKVLHAEVIDDDPNAGGTTRFQWSMFLRERSDFIHYKYRLFLSPDLAELSNYPEAIQWFTVLELWNERDPSLTASSPYNGTARWNVSINKDKGVGQPLYWTLDGEKMQPLSEAHQDIFPKQKSNASVNNYLGKWVDFDFYWKKGQTNGRIIVKLDNATIFDFTGLVGYPNRPELSPAYGGQAINVFKLYTSDQILDWMRGRGKKVSARYDDFKWYKE